MPPPQAGHFRDLLQVGNPRYYMRYNDPFKISGEDISAKFVKEALQESKKLYVQKVTVKEQGDLDEASTPKILRKTRKRAAAGRPLAKGTATVVASDPKQDLQTSIEAGDKLTHKQSSTDSDDENSSNSTIKTKPRTQTV